MAGELDQAVTRHGRVMFFRNDSGAVSRSLREYGEWAENELSFMRRFVSPGGTIVDVGAYIGTHTLVFANYVGATGEVIAIEAQPASYKVLSANIAANNLRKVTAYHAIASNEIGDFAIPVLNLERIASFGSASLHATLLHEGNEIVSRPETSSQVVVRSLTLDSLDLPRCDLVKIDVEGVEDLVIEGGFKTIRRYTPVIYCECNSVEDGLRSVAVLRSVGYSVYAHIVEAFNKENFRGNKDNIFGSACEVALIGVSPGQEGLLHSIPPRDIELVLQISTADDLVLALLNKPQYPEEILRPSAAARSGGHVYLDRVVRQRLELDAYYADREKLKR